MSNYLFLFSFMSSFRRKNVYGSEIDQREYYINQTGLILSILHALVA